MIRTPTQEILRWSYQVYGIKKIFVGKLNVLLVQNIMQSLRLESKQGSLRELGVLGFFSVKYVHKRRGGRLLQCAEGILLELTGVKVFMAIGMKGGKKFLRTGIASTTNQDLRDKDLSNFWALINFKYPFYLSSKIGRTKRKKK